MNVTWEFSLCDKGLERVQVMRSSVVVFEGSIPTGYTMHLAVGDSVCRWDSTNRKWKRKFRLEMFNGKPAVCYADGRKVPLA